MAAKDALGKRGEDLAAAYLTDQGLVVLDRNWRCRLGELDIVATDRPWVEVRYDVLAVLAEPGAPVRVHHYEAAF